MAQKQFYIDGGFNTNADSVITGTIKATDFKIGEDSLLTTAAADATTKADAAQAAAIAAAAADATTKADAAQAAAIAAAAAPDLTGLATETYVGTAIAAIPATDLTGLATETYVGTAIAAAAPDLTGLATETYVGTAISNLVDTAPATLDTLNELAAALGDDPNFATTVTNSIATKASITYVDSSIAAIPATDLTGLATETYVGTAIAAIPATDLTGLATETYVGTAIAAIPATGSTSFDLETAATVVSSTTITGFTTVQTPSYGWPMMPGEHEFGWNDGDPDGDGYYENTMPIQFSSLEVGDQIVVQLTDTTYGTQIITMTVVQDPVSWGNLWFSANGATIDSENVTSLGVAFVGQDFTLDSALETGVEYFTNDRDRFIGDGSAAYSVLNNTAPLKVYRRYTSLVAGASNNYLDTLNGSAGAFTSITEGDNTGYGTFFRLSSPERYGNIGNNAVDLSYSSFPNNVHGATGMYSTAMGFNTTASKESSTAIGYQATASGIFSTAIGSQPTASGVESTAVGYNATASGDMSIAMAGGVASGVKSVAMGPSATASSYASTAMGNSTTASSQYSTVAGRNGGIGTANTTLFGVAYATTYPGNITATSTDTNLVFKVSRTGDGYFDGGADLAAADYAEYFESFDGTPLERGHFVSFVEGSDCIAYGNSNILGIVSSSPAVVGDSQSMHYKGMYKKDEFDTYIRKPVVVTEVLSVLSAQQTGDSWRVVKSGSFADNMETFLIEIKNKETQEVLETITDETDVMGFRRYAFEVEVVGTYTTTQIDKVLSDTFDETQEYVPRSARPEWSPIGLLGKLWVYLADGETVKVGDYITSDTDGKAVLCSRSDAYSYRVLEVNPAYNLVKVFYK